MQKGKFSNGKTKSKFPKKSSKQRFQPKKDSESKRVNFDNERESKFDKEFKRNDGNDISWYTKNPGLTLGAARIPFNAFLGSRPPYLTESGFTVPGIMCLKFTPNFIPDDGFTLNQCAQSYYSNVVHANSRNQSYDAADLMIVTLAAAQVYACIGAMIRAYGLMNQFVAQNGYLPDHLLEALGFDPLDLRANYSHMLFDVNNLIAQSRQLWVPNTLPIINRWFWMNTTIYADSDNIKPQYYAYRQVAYYKYEGFTDRKGGKLTMTTLPAGFNGKSWDSWKKRAQIMIDALLTDQDRGIMFGDILKAYSAEKIFVLNEIDISYKTELTYSPEVLWQIENATQGISNRATLLELTQTEQGVLKQTWKVDYMNYSERDWYRPNIGLLNFHQKEDPTPEQIMVATRMMALGNQEAATDDAAKFVLIPKASGTELITAVFVVRLETTNAYSVPTYSNIGFQLNPGSISLDYMFAWAAFDWAPALYETGVLSTHTTELPHFFESITRNIISEYENYTYIDAATLERIHKTAIYSLFDVPLL